MWVNGYKCRTVTRAEDESGIKGFSVFAASFALSTLLSSCTSPHSFAYVPTHLSHRTLSPSQSTAPWYLGLNSSNQQMAISVGSRMSDDPYGT